MKEAMTKRDAIGEHTCDTCPFWHNPLGSDIGLCIRQPYPFQVGVAPVSPIANPTKPGQVVPVIKGLFMMMGAKEGCGQHPHRLS